MKKHILVDPGMLPLEKLEEAFYNFQQKQDLTLLAERRRKNEYSVFHQKLPVVFYEDFGIEQNNKLSPESLKKYDQARINIINDHRTLLIAERVNKIHPWNSLFNLIPYIEKIIYNFLYFHEQHPVDSILFQATPHNLPNWVLAKTAEIAGIKVRMMQTSPLPWRYWIVEGLDEQNPVFPGHNNDNDIGDKLLNNFFRTNEMQYDKAIPEYEKRRIESRKGKYWSWEKEIKDCFKNPKKAVSLSLKRKLFKLYDSLTKVPDLNQKYIVYFLHFQPERTSLPEALEFSNQWLIIRMISSSLPKDWKLLVKEHPSTYTNHFDTRYRNSQFYKDIASLNNVLLVPLDFNTFDLIDYSQGIATITGTVGVQALIRKKPVLTFGLASYRKLNNVFNIKTNKDMEAFFLREDINENRAFEDLKSIIAISVSGVNPESKNDKGFYMRENRKTGHIYLLKSYLKLNY